MNNIDTNNKICKTIASYKIDSIDINKNIEHISNIYNNRNILKNSFKSTSIGFAYFPNTLIPSSYFSKKEDNNMMLEFRFFKYFSVIRLSKFAWEGC